MALSKNRIKYIHSLEQKKNRKADKVFLAEGPKLVGICWDIFLSVLAGNFRMAFPEPPSLHRNGCHGSIGGGTFACQPAENSPTSAGCVPAAG